MFTHGKRRKTKKGGGPLPPKLDGRMLENWSHTVLHKYIQYPTPLTRFCQFQLLQVAFLRFLPLFVVLIYKKYKPQYPSRFKRGFPQTFFVDVRKFPSK